MAIFWFLNLGLWYMLRVIWNQYFLVYVCQLFLCFGLDIFGGCVTSIALILTPPSPGREKCQCLLIWQDNVHVPDT